MPGVHDAMVTQSHKVSTDTMCCEKSEITAFQGIIFICKTLTLILFVTCNFMLSCDVVHKMLAVHVRELGVLPGVVRKVFWSPSTLNISARTSMWSRVAHDKN